MVCAHTQMGTASLENRLLQYNAKGHFMNALLCYMAMGDEVRACVRACLRSATEGQHRPSTILD